MDKEKLRKCYQQKTIPLAWIKKRLIALDYMAGEKDRKFEDRRWCIEHMMHIEKMLEDLEQEVLSE